jgi:hypothetical protein
VKKKKGAPGFQDNEGITEEFQLQGIGSYPIIA